MTRMAMTALTLAVLISSGCIKENPMEDFEDSDAVVAENSNWGSDSVDSSASFNADTASDDVSSGGNSDAGNSIDTSTNTANAGMDANHTMDDGINTTSDNTDRDTSTETDSRTDTDTSPMTQVCEPGKVRNCAGLYGNCASGTETCNTDGSGWRACTILPLEKDLCTPLDDRNCNGIPNEGCTCEEIAGSCGGDLPYCLNETCVECQPALKRCNSNNVEQCGSNGYWAVSEECTEDQLCNAATGTCCTPDVCIGGNSCNASGNVVCQDDCGTEILVKDCVSSSSNGACTAGKCGCAAGWTGASCERCLFYVNGTTGSASNDGHTWGTAFASLHQALDAADADGCAIWAAKGTYKPEADINGNASPADPKDLTFLLREEVAVYGGFTGDEFLLEQRNISANETILSGDIAGDDGDNVYENDADNSYHVVMAFGTNPERLDGFTITGGRGGTSDDQDGSGGGMYNQSDLFLENCRFIGNVSNIGSALYNSAGRPKIENCLFKGNKGNTESSDGSVYNYNSVVMVSNSVFISNTEPLGGGGMVNYYTDGYIYNCLFTEQAFPLANQHNSSPVISNCTFAYNPRSGYIGTWAIYNGNNSSPTIQNCIFWENADNTADPIKNVDDTCRPTISYSALQLVDCADIEYAICGAGNINDDPLFNNEENGDFTLFIDSPCRDHGDNASVAQDRTDLDGDGIGAELIPFDLAGGARINGVVDMGAYEY